MVSLKGTIKALGLISPLTECCFLFKWPQGSFFQQSSRSNDVTPLCPSFVWSKSHTTGKPLFKIVGMFLILSYIWTPEKETRCSLFRLNFQFDILLFYPLCVSHQLVLFCWYIWVISFNYSIDYYFIYSDTCPFYNSFIYRKVIWNSFAL